MRKYLATVSLILAEELGAEFLTNLRTEQQVGSLRDATSSSLHLNGWMRIVAPGEYRISAKT